MLQKSEPNRPTVWKPFGGVVTVKQGASLSFVKFDSGYKASLPNILLHSTVKKIFNVFTKYPFHNRKFDGYLTHHLSIKVFELLEQLFTRLHPPRGLNYLLNYGNNKEKKHH